MVLATEEVESNDEPAGVRDKPGEDLLDGCEAILEVASQGARSVDFEDMKITWSWFGVPEEPDCIVVCTHD